MDSVHIKNRKKTNNRQAWKNKMPRWSITKLIDVIKLLESGFKTDIRTRHWKYSFRFNSLSFFKKKNYISYILCMGSLVNLVYHFGATDSRNDTSDSAQWVDLYRWSFDDLNLLARLFCPAVRWKICRATYLQSNHPSLHSSPLKEPFVCLLQKF